jgi:hypothetical protein
MRTFFLIFIVLALWAPSASANGEAWSYGRIRRHRHLLEKARHRPQLAVARRFRADHDPGELVEVPELDPLAASSAAALLLGGLAITMGRRRRRPGVGADA